MDVWSSYALSDFLLFSPQAYFRQFALINETAVPLPLLLHGLAAALLWLSGSSIPWRRRAVLIGLAVLWASSAWLFHWRSYAAINWVAAWFAAGHRSTEPAQAIALEKLGLEPILDVSMRLGEGSGAMAAVPLVRSSVALLRDVALLSDILPS